MTAIEILLFSLAYLFGSLSSAVVICKLFKLPDPRQTGSNNPGATNVYRLGGRIPAILTLVSDVLKGFLPTLLGAVLGFSPLAVAIIGLFACLGHMFPLFFQFRGGKGVATALGVLLSISPSITMGLMTTWCILVFITGYSSLGAVCVFIATPALFWLFETQYFWPVLLMCSTIMLRHKDNIIRLLQGKEYKVWTKHIVRDD